ncbi:hypothetical protein ACFP1L_11090 [Lactiplantibacillus nangangensis]|uniref:Uncharacterized protein n=1 Tax=Lactiplantibacillus nangangensis TaxID=2559917 RepID=A0ABW1SM86_9LACO|nr:hypothetical protein [Lactiplantibacillus nangangensis]
MADEEDHMTRQRYREQQAQPDPADEPTADPDEGSSESSRRAYAAENNRALVEAKSKRLGRKLNWVILGLVLAIIIVFLILFLTP